MQLLVALLVGLLFGTGLILAGMSNPAKVLGFLDLAGRWDPSLGLVMAGAVLPGLIVFRHAAGRARSLLDLPMRLPAAGAIDRRLVLGSAAFGVGWGLAGLCPGPALALLLIGGQPVLVFTGAMLAGMGIFELMER